jgi:hypothetical protein
MPAKKFTTAEDLPEERQKVVHFDLDGKELTARKPKTFAMIEMANAAEGDSLVQVQALVHFMNETLDPTSRAHIQSRMADPDDTFDIEDLAPISNWLLEQFTARPTTRSRASAARPRKTGSASTGRARSKASTRSTSRPTASATSSRSGSPSD